jgi:hypothetical protein
MSNFNPLFLFAVFAILSGCGHSAKPERTVVSIKDSMFLINGEPTYKGVYWNGHKIEGLLMNSRMVQGVFDDENPETAHLWKYPDTGLWDANRNTDEFIAAMPIWKEHGLLAFTLNLQGGSPTGYGNSGWVNTAFDAKGNLKPLYLERLEKILDKTDELGMVCILGYFYFGQDEFLEDETAIINAVEQTTNWLLEKGYKNILVEVNNECNINAYDHPILRPDRVHELINRVKSLSQNGKRLLVGTSYGGGTIPYPNVVGSSDFILIHGNGVDDPGYIKEMVIKTKQVEGYRTMPILFNEDDHFNFDQPINNMVAAVQAYASWGYFDFRGKKGHQGFEIDEPFEEGYQSVPIDWGINSERKKGFFNLLKVITSGN